MPTESASQALKILRDASLLHWYVIPLLAFVVYTYAVEVERRNWNIVFAGLAFWGMDWFNEIWNGLVFHFTNYAPVWGTPRQTAFLILIGLNIEICCMFAVAGVGLSKVLPADKHAKILGIPNRIVFAVIGSVSFLVGEMLLNAAGLIAWDYPWWSTRAPWLIFLIGYMPFFLVAYWVHDMESVRRQVAVVATLGGVDLLGLVLFGVVLRWI